MPKDNKVKKEKKHFFRDFKAELKRVIWPTPKQLINNTIAVITIVLITAAVVFALDFVFENMNKYGINKIKETFIIKTYTFIIFSFFTSKYKLLFFFYIFLC